MVVGQLFISHHIHRRHLYSAAKPSWRNGLITTWCDAEYLARAEPLRRTDLLAAAETLVDLETDELAKRRRENSLRLH